MMNKPYFTRKNLIAIAMAFFYSFLLLFVGLCIEGSFKFANEDNPIAMIAETLNFKLVSYGVSGYICLILIAIYVVAGAIFIIYERRYAIVNNKSPYSAKMIGIYCATGLVCLLLSLGIGIILQSPLNKENIGNVLTAVWQSVLLTTAIYILIALFISAILMLVVNLIFIDKPYRFFSKRNAIEFEDEDLTPSDNNVTASFDPLPVATTSQQITASSPSATPLNTNEGFDYTSEEKLGTREKVFPSLSKIDDQYEGYAIESIPSDDYSLEQICHMFRNYLAKEEKLYFDIDTLRIFVSSFITSHFMILEGLSGTGKSSLPRYFAKFIHANVLFIPVQATWRDKTHILGYFNDFSKTYAETDFLIHLYEANYNPDRIHLFVLDEMNISRVEYYFADFLSVLEYPADSWKLRIMQLPYQFIPPAKLPDGFIQIPENVYFVGTANKDDSTFSITDKVYDRAITIDFDNRNIPFEVKEEAKTIQLSYSKFNELLTKAIQTPDYQMTPSDYEKFQKICDYIDETFDITFGNRVMNQISTLVPAFIACGGQKEVVLDFLLARKILVKLEGRFEEYIKTGLKHLLTLIEKQYGNTFVKSEKIIQSLIRKL